MSAVVVLAFAVTVFCLSPLPDGSAGARWILLSAVVPFLCLRCEWRNFAYAATLALAYAGASLFWSPDPLVGIGMWWQFALLVGIAAAAPDDMRPVYWAIGLALAVNSGVVALQIAGYEPVAHIPTMSATGLFFNKNQQNLYVALAIIGLVSLRDWRAYVLAAVAALPLFIEPYTRTPFIALGAVAGVVLIRLWLPLIVPVALAGLAGFLNLAAASVHAIPNAERMSLWVDMMPYLAVFGSGLGGFGWQYPYMEHAHSDALQMAYEFGLPGLVCYIVTVAYLLWSGPPVERLIILAFAVEGLFDFPLYQPCTAFLAALAAGRILHARRDLRLRFIERQHFDWTGKTPPRPA